MTDLTDSLKKLMRSETMKIDDMLPATVVSYDEDANRATIQPLVTMMTQDGEKVSRAQVFDAPVFRFGGGGFFIRYPIKAGDFGWLKANDRDISLILQNGGVQEDMPNTERLHSFSDALFIPDALKGWAVAGKNKDAMVIQSLDGKSVIALHNNKIVIEAGTVELGADGATEPVVLGDALSAWLTSTLKAWLDSHTHSAAGAGSPNVPFVVNDTGIYSSKVKAK
jgi:hypothetical protein